MVQKRKQCKIMLTHWINKQKQSTKYLIPRSVLPQITTQVHFIKLNFKTRAEKQPSLLTWSCHNAVQSNSVWIFKIISVCHVMVPFLPIKNTFSLSFTSGKMKMSLQHFIFYQVISLENVTEHSALLTRPCDHKQKRTVFLFMIFMIMLVEMRNWDAIFAWKFVDFGLMAVQCSVSANLLVCLQDLF